MTTDNPLNAEFQCIRDEMHVPRGFPPEVLIEAEAASRRSVRDATHYADLLDIPFVTIDPPGSRDLDQAFFAARQGDGFLVRYAIDDIGFFVERGGAIEQEAWQRGLTFYSPDVRTPLYPPVLSEGAASLLPGQTRPAVVFTFSLDARGEVERFEIARAIIRSRAQLTYTQVDAYLTTTEDHELRQWPEWPSWSESLHLLKEIGQLRQMREAERGGVSLRIPAQEIERWTAAMTGYRLAFETSLEVEGWNAQISLMTGMAAARMTLERGAGLLRILDPPRTDRVQALRLTAAALGVAWPDAMAYDDFVRGLDPRDAAQAVMLHQAARVTGAARYVAFDGEPRLQSRHAAVAAPYAHVTAPLRRLADRYVLDLLVAFAEGRQPDAALLEALSQLPRVMADADNRANRLESALLDFVEARLMQDRIGEVFNATVIAFRGDGMVVQIADPPIRTVLPTAAFAPGKPVKLSDDNAEMTIGATTLRLGQALRLRLVMANPAARSLRFSPVPIG